MSDLSRFEKFLVVLLFLLLFVVAGWTQGGIPLELMS